MADLAYHEPDTLQGALKLLSQIEGARCIAGGQTLVAMLNARLVEPAALVSLARIRDLSAISLARDGALRIGATATHETVAESPEVARGFPLIAQTARAIAHPPIRAFGTIGGAVAHGDPASDYPTALVAADAMIEIAAPKGVRTVAAAEFFVDYLTTALEPAEIVSAVIVPPSPPGSRAIYLKYSRVDGDYATLAVAALLAVKSGGCAHLAVALGAAGPTPVRDREAEKALIGKPLTEASVAAFAAALAERCDPVDDVRGSSEYRRGLIPGLVARALGSIET
ncbi:MAG: FAD binding domain-containing protein [Alphaproteobacteria bacterium]